MPCKESSIEKPEILNHNIETVPRLYPTVRPQAKYHRSLKLLQIAKEQGFVSKTGMMLGLGETEDEIDQVLDDLVAIGCEILTLGQYLQPTAQHLPVVRWVHPDEFAAWKTRGEVQGHSPRRIRPAGPQQLPRREAGQSARGDIGRPEDLCRSLRCNHFADIASRSPQGKQGLTDQVEAHVRAAGLHFRDARLARPDDFRKLVLGNVRLLSDCSKHLDEVNLQINQCHLPIRKP